MQEQINILEQNGFIQFVTVDTGKYDVYAYLFRVSPSGNCLTQNNTYVCVKFPKDNGKIVLCTSHDTDIIELNDFDINLILDYKEEIFCKYKL